MNCNRNNFDPALTGCRETRSVSARLVLNRRTPLPNAAVHRVELYRVQVPGHGTARPGRRQYNVEFQHAPGRASVLYILRG